MQKAKKMLVGHYLGVFEQDGWRSRFRPEIPLQKLDYLFLAFARIVPEGDGYGLQFASEDEKRVQEVKTKLKEVNPWAHLFVTVIADATYEDHFIHASKDKNFPTRVLHFLNKYELDGFDIDWEVGIEKEPLQELLINLYHVLNPAYKYLFMTIIPEIGRQYNYHLMGIVLDHVQIMCYGLSDWTQLIKDLITKGIPASKLVLGVETEVPYPSGTDDEESIKTKVKLVRDYGLGGLVGWRADNDHTNEGPNPTYKGMEMIWNLTGRNDQ